MTGETRNKDKNYWGEKFWTEKLFEARNRKEAEKALKNGADLNARNKDGWTPAMVAGFRGRPDVLELLIEKGADINALGPNGENIFIIILDGLKRRWEGFLLTKEEVKYISGPYLKCLKIATKAPGVKVIDVKDKNGRSALRLAASGVKLVYVKADAADADEGIASYCLYVGNEDTKAFTKAVKILIEGGAGSTDPTELKVALKEACCDEVAQILQKAIEKRSNNPSFFAKLREEGNSRKPLSLNKV